jgi:hypothetical protein
MKKSELKTGMWVECRGGYRASVMLDTPHGDIATNGGTYVRLDETLEDLTDKDEKKYDIIKVFKPLTQVSCASGALLTLIWEREPQPIEMTLEEACKKLRDTMGQPVKITI